MFRSIHYNKYDSGPECDPNNIISLQSVFLYLSRGEGGQSSVHQLDALVGKQNRLLFKGLLKPLHLLLVGGGGGVIGGLAGVCWSHRRGADHHDPGYLL